MKKFLIFFLIFIQFNISAENFNYSLGLNNIWQARTDYASRYFYKHYIEIFLEKYQNVYANYWSTYGLSLIYSDDNSDSPSGFTFIERDFGLNTHFSLLYDYIIVPEITLGMTNIYRQSKISTQHVDITASKMLTSQYLFGAYFQIGIGLPAIKNIFLIKPIFRYMYLLNDKRLKYALGIEISLGW